MAREFLVPPRVIWGKEALGTSAEYIRRMGKKALIVTGPHVAALGGVEALQRELEKRGVSSSVFAGITGEPEDWMIDRGTEAYKKEACDFLIGFGGGSPPGFYEGHRGAGSGRKKGGGVLRKGD